MGKRCLPGLLIVLVVILVLSSCGGAPAGGSSVWIDVPLDGLSFPDVQEINIEGHAASSGAGVSKVEVWVNGVLFITINDPPTEGALGIFQVSWTPPAAGEYTIQAIAFGADGNASQPDTARVSFGGIDITATPVPVITETLIATVTPAVTATYTPTLPPAELIQFWAEPSTIEAGSCTLIRWHVENVQKVIFGGLEQQFDGSYKDCLCSNQRYTLTVIKQDGSEQKTPVDITVTGSCITATPVDSTPPPAPSPAVPADGLGIACKGSQTLAWRPVDDPSGISRYDVIVQRHSGDNNWQAAPGGDQSLMDKTTSVPVECGWYYRWRVRAVDGVGNVGSWSGWSEFTIILG